jgi:IMP cyclohydrolase
MSNFNTDPSKKELQASEEALRENVYPGRVLIQGINSSGKHALQAYALMGRSPSSRNRMFDRTESGVRTIAPGMTEAQMAQVEGAELIYYKAMGEGFVDSVYVASNGAQTEPVLAHLIKHDDLEAAVRAAPTVKDKDGNDVNLSWYEPDDPNYTPRITGSVINLHGEAPFALTVVRRDLQTAEPIYTTTKGDLLELEPGVGYGVQTYEGGPIPVPSGDPLPSFDRGPYPFPLAETAEETAHSIWSVLNQDNRVAVVVRSIDLVSDDTDYYIINGRA